MPAPVPADRPNRIPWPPLLYVAALALPSLLQWLAPLPHLLPSGSARLVATGSGLALLAGGLGLDLLALLRFRSARTPFMPNQRAQHLVSGGLYERSRNPMYLGALIAFCGLALATGNAWRWAALPLLALGLHHLAILREEAHLEARFGEAWRDYAARVPRWL